MRNDRDGNAASRAVRVGRASLLGGALAVAAAGWLAGLSLPASAADPDVICEARSVCRIAKTRLPLRVLPRVSSSIYESKDPNSRVVESDVPAFVPLYVFERSNVSYADPLRPTGWFGVGKDLNTPIGYVKAADALEWKSAVVVSYTHRGVGENERKPVIMFKDRKPLEQLVLDPQLPERSARYYRQLASRDVPAEVITREPDTFVDIRKKFYLLPVLESIDLSDQGLDDARLLQIAAAVPDKRARPEQQCSTERADFARCARETGTVGDNELRINVVYVIDFTESMQPYIDVVTNATRDSARILSEVTGREDRVRFGLIGYRDHADSSKTFEFVVKNFTPELVNQRQFVQVIQQHGKTRDGGDYAEDVFAGVLEGLNSKWDPGAIKLVFLIGDASGHEPSHKFASTKHDSRSVRQLATEQGVNVASFYIKAARATYDWERGIEQFRILAENPGVPVASGRAVDENPTEIGNAILEVTREWRDRLIKLHGDKLARAPARGPAGANPFSEAFRAALVEFVGKATEPPKDITAWVADRDLTNLARRAFDVHVLVSRKDLDELTRGLQDLVDAYEGAKLTNETFFKTLQAMTTLRGLDGGDVSKATALARTNLLPRWIESLPYKSQITAMKFSDFEDMTADKSQQLQAKLRSLITTYKSIAERQDSWVRLNEVMKYEDHVYPLLLDNLP
jgi:serine/threonine-protein kinase PpkA